MGGGKNSYSRSIRIERKQAIRNKELQRLLDNAKKRYRKYKKDMRPVNMDDLVNLYAPGEKPYFDNYKIKYHKEGSNYVIVADPSGYVRVLDLRTNTFVDVYTRETLKRSDPDYEARTHYRVLRRDEL